MSILQRLRAWLGRSHADSYVQGPNRPAAQPATPPVHTPVTVIDLETAYAAYEAGARFVDVREPHEWTSGHVAGAVHHPVGALEAQPEISVARDATVITYCAAGARAACAAAALAANGYSDVQTLDSGYADWAAAGYPVEHPDHAPDS